MAMRLSRRGQPSLRPAAGAYTHRRYASVQVEGWQDNRDRIVTKGTAHFVMPPERFRKQKS